MLHEPCQQWVRRRDLLSHSLSQSDLERSDEFCDLFDHVVFTDELGLEFWKPHTKPFELICEQAEVDYNEAVYIADNPLKDFKAPNDLGMHSLRVRRFGGEHSLKEAPSKEYEAEYEINSLMNLLDIFLRTSFDSGHAKLMTKNII